MEICNPFGENLEFIRKLIKFQGIQKLINLKKILKQILSICPESCTFPLINYMRSM